MSDTSECLAFIIVASCNISPHMTPTHPFPLLPLPPLTSPSSTPLFPPCSQSGSQLQLKLPVSYLGLLVFICHSKCVLVKNCLKLSTHCTTFCQKLPTSAVQYMATLSRDGWFFFFFLLIYKGMYQVIPVSLSCPISEATWQYPLAHWWLCCSSPGEHIPSHLAHVSSFLDENTLNHFISAVLLLKFTRKQKRPQNLSQTDIAGVNWLCCGVNQWERAINKDVSNNVGIARKYGTLLYHICPELWLWVSWCFS